MRDVFRRELKKTKAVRSGDPGKDNDSKWPYFKSMLFLTDTLTPRDLKGSTPPVEEGEEVIDESTFLESSPPCFNETELATPPPSKLFKSPAKKGKQGCRKTNNEIDQRLLEIEEKKLEYFQHSQDSNVQFLMSLLPFLHQIPKSRQLIVRTKLMQVLMDEQNQSMCLPSTSNYSFAGSSLASSYDHHNQTRDSLSSTYSSNSYGTDDLPQPVPDPSISDFVNNFRP